MDLDRIKEIIGEIEEIEEETGDESLWFSGKTLVSDIKLIEKELSVKLCKEYREFLKRFGTVSCGGIYLVGIWPGDPLLDSEGTILYHSKEFEQHGFALGNKTILDPGDEEYYRIIDHDLEKLFTYDRFSKKYEPSKYSVGDYIVQFFERCLKLAKI